MAGDHHTNRFDLIDTGIGGVEDPCVFVEADLTLYHFLQLVD